MQDLNAFVTFATIIETGSFSRAAEKLGISKALVSKQIAALENELGVKLLNRNTRRIGRTTAGQIFHEHCLQLIAHAESSRHELEQFSNVPGGLLKINAGIAFGRRHLVPAIAAFTRRYPKINVHLDLSDRLIDLIGGGVDVMVRMADEPRLHSLVARKLAPLRWVVCATPAYLKQHRAPRVPEDLASHNCIVYMSNPRGIWHFTGPDGNCEAQVTGNFKVNNADGIVQAVLADLGIAVMPSFAAVEHLSNRRMVRLLPEYRLPERTLYAAHLPNPHMPQRTRLFVRFLGEYLGSPPYWDRQLEDLSRPPESAKARGG
jgi:LysR family transcriptional regulator for bpeEF and oprC